MKLSPISRRYIGRTGTSIPIPKTDFLNEAKTGVAIDVHTGEITDILPFAHNQHHHRCYRDKATERFILMGYSGIQLIDPETKSTATNQWVRGICQYGIMPANGYIYVPADPCGCYSTVKINGFFALGERNSLDDHELTPVLEKGPAYEQASARRGAGAGARGIGAGVDRTRSGELVRLVEAPPQPGA